MRWPLFNFYCCLNPVEKTVIAALCVFYRLTPLGVLPESAWNLLWPDGTPSLEDRKAIFIYAYGLVRVDECVPPDFTEACIVFDDVTWWSDASVWILTPAATCPTGCDLPVWP